MIMNEIERLREELNTLIHQRADFAEITRVSQELDECLLKYYNEKLKREE